jgi:hypothetical protein
MTEHELATLRESLQDVSSALTGLLMMLTRGEPLQEPRQQEMLRDLYGLAADACDRLRGVRAKRAIEKPLGRRSGRYTRGASFRSPERPR